MNLSFFLSYNFPLQSRTKSSKKLTTLWTTTRMNGETVWLKVVIILSLIILILLSLKCISLNSIKRLICFWLLIKYFFSNELLCKFWNLSRVLTFASEYHVHPYVACFMFFYGKHVYTLYCRHLCAEINTRQRHSIIVFIFMCGK